MTITEELQILRAEMRGLRQRVSTTENAWKKQTLRADKLEKGNNLLRSENRGLRKENKELKEKIDSLTDHKDKLAGMIFKPNLKKKQTTEDSKQRGGQKGHKGHMREKPKHVDERKHIYLTHCPCCSKEVKRSDRTYTRIVEDLPEPQPIVVTEYTIEKQKCFSCKKDLSAIPKNTVSYSPFGVNIITMILTLKYNYRLPIAKIQEFSTAHYQLSFSQGAIQNTLHRTRKHFGSEYDRILEKIRNSPYKHADETGWRVEGQNSWCWLFSTPKEAFYTIEENRGKGVTDVVLTKNPKGVLVRDDYGAYKHLKMPQQSCWVHLLRNSRETKSVEAQELHLKLKQMFQELDNLIKQPFCEENRLVSYEKYKTKINKIINIKYKETDTLKVQTRIKNQNTNLITALLYESVPLTNNHAEQQIRPLTVQRKISGGSRSINGAKTHAVNMSVIQTLKLKGTELFSGLQLLLVMPNQRFVVERGE